jgi:acyl-coenzyme A synthetase/AMP-(fatty) acid ligase
MPNIGSYEDQLKSFNWSLAEKELEYCKEDFINIGWYSSDRICLKGNGSKIALYYEDFAGSEKRFTFNDIRLASNTIGTFLSNLG